jgi:hypothetical protein
MTDFLKMLASLDSSLRARRGVTDLYEDYYLGQHRLAYTTEKFRDAFGDLFAGFADNWCGVVVDASAERLKVEGFTGDKGIDQGAWDFWSGNDMEVLADQAMTGAVKSGVAYVLVDATGDEPTVTVWPASMAIVRRDPKTRKALAGMTQWVEDDGRIGAQVFLPEGSQQFVSKPPEKTADADVTRMSASGAGTAVIPSEQPQPGDLWESAGELIPNPHKDGSIPLVELVNRPNELGLGRSDLDDVIPLQDAINKLTNDMIVASEFAAFPQRVLTGIEIPKDPTTGEPLPSQQLQAAISRLWSFEDKDAKITSLTVADLTNYVAGIKEVLNHLAAQTRTPPHYLIGQMINISGDALAAAESGLVGKVQSKQTSFAVSWREVVRLATDSKIQIVWRNPERVSLAAIADAVLKMSDPKLGIPREKLWQRLGFSPLEIEEMKKDPAAALTAVTGTPAPDPSSPTPPPPPSPDPFAK